MLRREIGGRSYETIGRSTPARLRAIQGGGRRAPAHDAAISGHQRSSPSEASRRPLGGDQEAIRRRSGGHQRNPRLQVAENERLATSSNQQRSDAISSNLKRSRAPAGRRHRRACRHQGQSPASRSSRAITCIKVIKGNHLQVAAIEEPAARVDARAASHHAMRMEHRQVAC